MASSTRSAFTSKVEPGTSSMVIRPVTRSFTQATRAQVSDLMLPWPSSLKAFVVTDQSRWPPSSCELEVRSFTGQ